MDKLKLAVIFGGASSEHEVSLNSAESVIDNIPRDKYDVIMIGITKSGKWLLYQGGTESLPDGTWEKGDVKPAFIAPDREIHGIAAGNETIRIDAVFPVLHGANGEDGTVQGLFTLAGIPFVGCPVAASAVCMDKALTKMVLGAAGIHQAEWDCTTVYAYRKDSEAVLDRVVSKLPFPIFVKPANAGSSVGITKAGDREALKKAVETALAFDSKVVFEETVAGLEIECAVLGNDDPEVSCCGEIVPCNEFYDYDAKYLAGRTGLYIPARLDTRTSDQIRETAKRAYSLLGCKGLTRMDFFVREKDGAVLLNEPNTIPGFTSISMYPKLFEASGIPYSDLIDKLVKLAIER